MTRRWEFRLPDIGEGVAEGEIVGWLVKPGDAVREDEPIVEMMTDKATVTITAPKAGTVIETRGRIGEVVPVHSVLVVFELDAPPPAAAPQANGGHGAGVDGSGEAPAAMAVGDIQETLPGVTAPAAAHGYYNEKPLATPATRKLARDMSVDLRRVPPSGPQGRVTKTDVASFDRPLVATHRGAAQGPDVGREPVRISPPPAAPAAAAAAGAVARQPRQQRIPFAGLRRKIAQKMSLSKTTAAHFTFVEECDVMELKALRQTLRGPAEAQGVSLNFLPFIIKAVVASLKKHPMLNSALDETTGEIVLQNYYNIGIATATASGLLVPVVKEADSKSILDIAREVDRLAIEARAGKAKLEDLHGSTFTITSLGAQGGLFATPIINFPEVAVLGVHQMKTKPVVRDGQIVIGDVMLLSLSFDHRIVDGHVGAAFAYEVIGYLEHPASLLL
jgi:pyruvate dehydrogenase E2 component (dihydrolipoamide acetyltransferase)